MLAMPVLCLLWLHCDFYACTILTMPVQCQLCQYYSSIMPTMSVFCVLSLYYVCNVRTMSVLCVISLYNAYYASNMSIYNHPNTKTGPKTYITVEYI